MSSRPKMDQRRADLAAIHMGKKSLGWDDETYRDLLRQLTGKSSSAELSVLQRGVVLDTMRELGFQRAAGSAARPRSTTPRASQADKVRALWDDLVALGGLRDSSDRALVAFVERQTKKSRLEWCTPHELNKVIEGLKAMLARARSDS